MRGRRTVVLVAGVLAALPGCGAPGCAESGRATLVDLERALDHLGASREEISRVGDARCGSATVGESSVRLCEYTERRELLAQHDVSDARGQTTVQLDSLLVSGSDAEAVRRATDLIADPAGLETCA